MGLKERMIAATEEFAIKNGYNLGVETGSYTESQKGILEAFADFTEICDTGRRQLSKLVAAMTGISADDLLVAYKTKNGKKVGFIPDSVVVVLGNDNDHNYPLNKPLLMTRFSDGDVAMKSDGTVGNHMTHTKSLVRPATLEEIEQFFKEYVEG